MKNSEVQFVGSRGKCVILINKQFKSSYFEKLIKKVNAIIGCIQGFQLAVHASTKMNGTKVNPTKLSNNCTHASYLTIHKIDSVFNTNNIKRNQKKPKKT